MDLFSGRRCGAASLLSAYCVYCRRILDAALVATSPCITTALSTSLGQSEAPDPGGDGLCHHHICANLPWTRARGGGGGTVSSTLELPIDS